MLSLVGGLGLVLISLGVVYMIDQVLQIRGEDHKRYARPFFVGAILGFALTGWGVYNVFRSGRLLRRWKDEGATAEIHKRIG